jgi:hypothetical protein
MFWLRARRVPKGEALIAEPAADVAEEVATVGFGLEERLVLVLGKVEVLGYHLKTGHTLSLQNRATDFHSGH